MNTIRIFISSPSDVQDERERARDVIQRLRKRYFGQFELKPVLWEDLPLQPDMSFQQGTNVVLSDQGGIDIAVFILWARFGSPVGPGIRKRDNSEYRSGTECEYELMMQARAESARTRTRENGDDLRPDILVYRRIDENSFRERLRGQTATEKESAIAQQELVEAFFEKEFNDPATGTNRRAHTAYERLDQFSGRLRPHLQELLDRRAKDLPQETIWDIEAQGPPFMGLQAFQPKDADVFFGREEEILDARRALRAQARNGCAFLLVCGDSGSGKSSLVRAGILPAIVENELDEQVAVWRTLIITPSELAPDPVSALVSRLAADKVLPELLGEISAAQLADALRHNPAGACELQLKPALARAAERSKGPVRVLLVVDQLEELFASTAIDPPNRSAFLILLEALARSGSVWVVATVRADFYQQMQHEDGLVRMKSGVGQLDLLPPGEDALRRLIEEPADLAGLRFEKLADGENLSDRILRDARGHAELLPLVEDLLRELYETRSGDLLTFAAYKDLGGSVEGALARRADKVFDDLPVDAKASLAPVLEALVTHGQKTDTPGTPEQTSSPAGEERVVRQWAALDAFPDGSPARHLIDAFLTQRLFTAGKHPETGVAGITIAHESLLRVWPRAADWVLSNSDFLRTRALVARRLTERSPLPERDPLLRDAKDQLEKNPAGFSPELSAFIKKSVRNAKVNRAVRAGAVLLVSLLIVGLGGLWLYLTSEGAKDASAGQFIAEAKGNLSQRDYARAEIAAANALTYRDTLENRRLLLAARSGGVSFVSGSAVEAPQSVLSVFSRDGTIIASVIQGGDGVPVAVSIRSTSDHKELWRIELPASAAPPDSMALSEFAGNTRQISIAWPDGASGSTFRVGVWSLEDGKPAGRFRELTANDERLGRHTKRIPSLAFHPSQPWIATGGEDGKLCLWDHSQDKPRLIWEQDETHEPNVHGIAFNRDGSLLASGGGDYQVKIWRTAAMAANYGTQASYQPREKIEPVILSGHNDSVFAVAFSPKAGPLDSGEFSGRLASGGYDRIIRIWDLTQKDKDGKPKPQTVGTLSGHEGTVFALSFSDDGRLLTSGGGDDEKSVRLWDASEGRLLVAVTPSVGIVRSVASLSFEDGLHVGGEQGWGIWSVSGGSVITRLWNGGSTVGAIAFDPLGQYLAVAGSGNDGRILVWDRSYRLVKTLDPDSPEDSINGIAFSPDGRWIAAGGDNKVIHIWDRMHDWEKVKAADEEALKHSGAVWGLCFDPKGRWLASSNQRPNVQIKLWTLGDWSLKQAVTDGLQNDNVYTLACEDGGNRLISANSKANVTVWETDPLRPKTSVINYTDGELTVWSLAIAASPLSVLSGNSNGRVYRWIPDDPEWTGSNKKDDKIRTSDTDAKVNRTINSISHNQKYGWIAAGGAGQSVEIYNMNLQKIRSLTGHDGTVWFVSFDPQGSRLAYGGLDRILRVFDVDEMQRVDREQPKKLYQESQKSTGLSVVDGKIIVGTPAR